MRFVDNRSGGLKKVEDLACGSVFEWNGEIYIKTNKKDTATDNYICVNLDTGCVENFDGLWTVDAPGSVELVFDD